MQVNFKSGIKALSLIICIISFLAVSLYLFHPSDQRLPVQAESTYLFHPGFGNPTIDGYVDPGEWAGADSHTIDIESVSIAGTLTATLYVMQNETDLFLGYVLNDDEFTTDYLYGIYGDTAFIEFDDNNSGALYEVNENRVSIYASSPWYHDKYFFSDTGGAYDDITQVGGETNGAGASGRHGDLTHYELRFPLCSGDTYDFCLSPGDVLGLRVGYYDIYMGTSELTAVIWYYPSVSTTSLVTIKLEDFLFSYLPLVVK